MADLEDAVVRMELPKLSIRPPSSGTMAPGSTATSPPFTRESSPSPSSSPLSCPPLTRSFSSSEYSSSASTISLPSVVSRSSSASAAMRQRGYVRPQGVTFAPSAGNRDSVLSLGSIAHLQYYFARTGLLDGKGAQLAKDDRGKPGSRKEYSLVAPRIRPLTGQETASEDGADSFVEEPSQFEEPIMLPPTVSTYSHRTPYVPPPPDAETLREDLTKALKDAKSALQQISSEVHEAARSANVTPSSKSELAAESSATTIQQLDNTPSQLNGWHEIQGLHILDVVTLAIRAAKVYYTSHENPHRLYSIRSERRIREELLETMDILKKMAGRNFAGGMRPEELFTITSWVNAIESLLHKEEEMQKEETEQRASWVWFDGSWEGRERTRERLFLSSFHSGDALPTWDPVDQQDPHNTPFLDVFRTGLVLVELHNNILKKSKRQFGNIKTFHTDLAKPYRCAENLRYWMKAAELRWETKLKVDVSGIVNGKETAYADFDAAILQWSRVVRENLSREWEEASQKSSSPRILHEESTPMPF